MPSWLPPFLLFDIAVSIALVLYVYKKRGNR